MDNQGRSQYRDVRGFGEPTPLSIDEVLRLRDALQLQLLRAMLGDRLIESPYVEPGQALAIAPVEWERGKFEHLSTDGSFRNADPWERAARILRAGGSLVVSKEWADSVSAMSPIRREFDPGFIAPELHNDGDNDAPAGAGHAVEAERG